MHPARLLLPLLCLLLLHAAPAPAAELVGAIHEHSGYSDGAVGTRPADYYAAGREQGLDYVAGTEHAEILPFPGTLGEGCLSPAILGCLVADHVEPANAARKWAAAGEQARAATDAAFAGIRGFEWTSDRSGHLGVLFSANTTSAYVDGGNLTVDAFWSWFTRPVALGGGADALGIFNHPGDKRLSEEDPAFNWEDFRHVPAADDRMVGLEVFNGGSRYDDWLFRALDRGWHVGAVGAEDAHDERWAQPDRPKTVLLASERTPAGVRAALEARRFYAVARRGARLAFTVEGAPMGARLRRAAGESLDVRATALPAESTLELVTSGGRVLARGTRPGLLRVRRRAAAGERWYVVRAVHAGRTVAMSSPVWVSAGPPERTWLAGDLHVHACASHDVLCPGDTEPSEPWTLGLPVPARFAEAKARGLDYLAITDHNDTSSAADPGFGAHGVVGVPGYEMSVRGHAQVLGTTAVLDHGDASPAALRRLAAELHRRGGVLQANHPGDGETVAFGGCDSVGTGTGLHWKYGYDVPIDTVEVLNATSPARTAERLLDCHLDRGRRVGLTGGSDSHWAALAPVQGAGTPTTWVHAQERSARGVLRALREGRTSISRTPPAQGGGPLLLEHDADRDGTWDVAIGEAVPPGAPLRVRSPSRLTAGLVSVRGPGGADLVTDARLAPGGSVAFAAPRSGWVRAVLSAAPASAAQAPGCAPNGLPITTCAYDAALLGLTSPAYVKP